MPKASPDREPEPDESTESAEPSEPLNRAERRAQRRGKKPPLPAPGGQPSPAGRRQPVLPPRRSGRRGNR